MAYCAKCGQQYDNGVRFCPSCGAPADPPAQQTYEAAPNDAGQGSYQQQANYQQSYQQQGGFAAQVNNLNNTADTTADFDPADVEQNKAMGVLAYLSWLVLIPIFAAPKSRYARFHANQGLALAIVEIGWWILTSILSYILIAIAWQLAFISTILGLANILFLVLAILGIINAVNGKAKELPIIGKLRILK